MEKIKSDCPPTRTVDQLTQENVDKILALERSNRARSTIGDRVADAITRFCGTITFVVVHVIWYGAWLGANMLLPAPDHFDPYPYSFLTLVVSLEAIFLSAFILISQNRQGNVSERRSHLNLQIDILAEQENTKMLELLEKIARKVGVEPCQDNEVKALAEAVTPERLARQIDETIKRTEKDGN
jgi:uncharacterized membrane protein